MHPPAVAHYIGNYLALSENWIYELIRRHQRYPPIVLTQQTQNLDLFPLPRGRIISLSSRSLIQRIADRLQRRLGGVPIPSYVRAIRRCNAALIHAHFGSEGWKQLFLAEHTGRPLVTSFYGYDISALPRDPRWREHYRVLFARGDRFICLGQRMREQVVKLGCPPEKAVVLPFGANLQTFAYQPRRWDGNGPAIALMVGRFVAKKGHLIALQALARVRRSVPQAQLWLVGDGELRPQIERQISALGLDDAVRLFGSVPQPLATETGAAAHLFILPSLTAPNGDQEGLPMVLIEAQATGLPVLSTFHACIPEVVAHGESGLLAREGDVDALAANWLALLEKPATWVDLGRRGREIVEAHYDAARQAARLEELYDSVLVEQLR